MDADTLRSMGIPESKIQELMNEDFELMEDFSDMEEEEEEEIEDEDDLFLPMVEEEVEEEAEQEAEQVEFDEEDDNESAYKSSDEWWRDPLAAFDEEDEEDLDFEEPEEKSPLDKLLDERESTDKLEDADDEELLVEPEEDLIMEDLSVEDVNDEELFVEPEDESIEEEKEGGLELEEEEEDDDEVEAIEEIEIPREEIKLPQEEIEIPQEEIEIPREEIEIPQEEPIVIEETKPQDNEKQLEASTTFSSDIKSGISAPVAQAASMLAPTVKSLIASIGPLAATNPLVQVVGAAAIARALMLSAGPKKGRKKNKSKPLYGENDDLSALDEEFDAEMEAYRDEHAYSDEEEDYISLDDDERDMMQQQSAQSYDQSLPSHSRRRFNLPMSRIPNPFGGSKRLPSKHALLDEIEDLKNRVKIAEFERENVEKEYEETSMKLQETMTDLTNLQQTSKYLKSQLRDNEDALSRTVRAERRKAKEELKRMREAMLTVLERERKAMREKNEREIAELRSLMDEPEYDALQS